MFYGDKYVAEKLESTYKDILIELDQLGQEKQLMLAEEKITEEVRRRIQ